MKRERRNACAMIVALLVAIVAFSAFTDTAAVAQTDTCIPQDATVQSAIFSINIHTRSGQLTTIHRVTAPWGENSVTWNSFAGSFDPTVEGSFVADDVGAWPPWRSVDLTSLVQGWVDGTYPNYGIYLQMMVADYWGNFHSSEWTTESLRPKLDICYTVGGGGPICITIQRPSVAAEDVADSSISELQPDSNFGTGPLLSSSYVNGYLKPCLIWFDICQFTECIAPRTPGYWKTHPEAWPVSSLGLGCWTYTQAQLLTILWSQPKHDASIKLAQHLIAAKLNVLNGADEPSAVADLITEADALLCPCFCPLPYGVRQNTPLGQDMLEVATGLDDYNNGYLSPGCVPD